MKFEDEVCVRHLAGMVAFPTLSKPVAAEMDFAPFEGFRRYLEETYPLAHRTLSREVVGPAGLLYCWKGSGKSRREPLLLAAHQDIVPVGDPARWQYPPYGGVVADGFLWGRGSADDKSVIMSHFEAIEALIAQGFQPDYDIYLGYGFNEEVGGGDCNSAAAICRTLQERGVHLGCVIDEGVGPGPDRSGNFDMPVVNILVTEKGYADFEISIEDEGGHSMAPGKRSVIAELGQVAMDLHASPFPYRLTESVRAEYESKAPYMADGNKRALFADMRANFEQLLPYIDADPHTACKFHTTMAMTMSGASQQANILPTKAYIVMNCRLLEGDTLESVQRRVEEIVAGRAQVKLLKGNNPSPASRVDSHAYQCIRQVYQEMCPGVLVAPGIVSGGTDAKNYYPICDSVYRCGGIPGGSGENEHTFNERLKVAGCGKGPEFFARLIQKYNED